MAVRIHPLLAADCEPVVLARQLQHLPGFVWLDTAGGASTADSTSILAAQPVEVIAGGFSDWPALERKLAEYHSGVEWADDGLPRGAAIGSVDYDGTFYFGIYTDLAIFRHGSQTWEVVGDPSWPTEEPRWAGLESIRFRPLVAKDYFLRSVQRAQEYIAAGDIYQVNLSHPFVAETGADPFAFYEKLRTHSPAPHAAFLRQSSRTILSTSPETFLSMSGPTIRTRPIKGTRPRFRDAQKDERSAYELLTSAKEVAELVMITDLERNDLGQVCEYGSVTVTELLKLERFAQVFHLVSTVEGQLRAEVSHAVALRACFPGGSITGAPKKRAMEIIRELERYPRGLYTGAIGYFGFNRESRFSIAIRTVVMENQSAHFHVGAGIVADSVPEMEYEETLHKAAGILLAAE